MNCRSTSGDGMDLRTTPGFHAAAESGRRDGEGRARRKGQAACRMTSRMREMTSK